MNGLTLNPTETIESDIVRFLKFLQTQILLIGEAVGSANPEPVDNPPKIETAGHTTEVSLFEFEDFYENPEDAQRAKILVEKRP